MLVQCLLAAVLVFQACLATPVGFKPRITDGADAKPNEFPYQASLQWGIPPFIPYSHVCGCSIVKENFAMTAGHCIMKFGSFKVLAGKHLINDNEPNQQESDVEKAIVHKDYKGGIAQHDIALLRLQTPLVFNDKVAAVKLPTQNEKRTGDAVLTGWGSISKSLLPRLPPNLQKVIVPVLDNPSCLKKFPKDMIGKKPELFDTQICTDAVGEASACSGDSGGPLAQTKDGAAIQIGIVSWGVYPCGVGRVPSVYTRVASYVNWINNIMS